MTTVAASDRVSRYFFVRNISVLKAGTEASKVYSTGCEIKQCGPFSWDSIVSETCSLIGHSRKKDTFHGMNYYMNDFLPQTFVLKFLHFISSKMVFESSLCQLLLDVGHTGADSMACSRPPME